MEIPERHISTQVFKSSNITKRVVLYPGFPLTAHLAKRQNIVVGKHAHLYSMDIAGGRRESKPHLKDLCLPTIRMFCLLNYFTVLLFIWKVEKHRSRALPSAASLHLNIHEARPGPGHARSPAHACLLHQYQKSKYVSHQQLSSRVHQSRKLALEVQSWNSSPSTLLGNIGIKQYANIRLLKTVLHSMQKLAPKEGILK